MTLIIIIIIIIIIISIIISIIIIIIIIMKKQNIYLIIKIMYINSCYILKFKLIIIIYIYL